MGGISVLLIFISCMSIAKVYLPTQWLFSYVFRVVAFRMSYIGLLVVICNSESFHFFFIFRLLYRFQLPLLEFAKLKDKVSRADIFTFPILEGMFSVFRCWYTPGWQITYAVGLTDSIAMSSLCLISGGFFIINDIDFIRNLFATRDDHICFYSSVLSWCITLFCGYWNTFCISINLIGHGIDLTY